MTFDPRGLQNQKQNRKFDVFVQFYLIVIKYYFNKKKKQHMKPVFCATRVVNTPRRRLSRQYTRYVGNTDLMYF